MILNALTLLVLLTVPDTMTSDLSKDFATKSSQFSVDLYSTLSEGRDENIIVSPFSIQTCVALAYAGASGTTAEEIVKGLRLVSNDRAQVGASFEGILNKYKDSPLLKIANKVYLKNGYTLKAEFNEIAQKNFHSEAENVNFDDSQGAASTINNWVENKTNHKIQNLISSNDIDSLTRLILVNAIHFKGKWAKQFEKHATHKDTFYLNDNDSVQVDMMNKKSKFQYGRFDNLDAAVLELPYADSDLSMLILLPNQRTGLKDLEAKLKTVNLLDLAKDMYETDIVVKLPKFKVEYSVELTEPLKKLGMKTMFSNAATFDNLMESSEPLQVSKVVHKAFIEVNEEGTEAAAATGMIMMMRASLEPLRFNADHPFIYFLKDSQSILFAGQIAKLE